jgi:hypothetical protein
MGKYGQIYLATEAEYCTHPKGSLVSYVLNEYNPVSEALTQGQ